MALRRQMGEKVYQYFYNHLERIGMFKNLTMPEAAMAVQIIIFSLWELRLTRRLRMRRM